MTHLSVFVMSDLHGLICFFPICQHSGRPWWLAWETCKVLPDSYKAHLRRHTLLILTHDNWLKTNMDLQRNAPINHIRIHILEMDNTGVLCCNLICLNLNLAVVMLSIKSRQRFFSTVLLNCRITML